MRILILVLFFSSCSMLPYKNKKPQDPNTPRSFNSLKVGMESSKIKKGLGSPKHTGFKNGVLIYTYLKGRNMFTMGSYHRLFFKNDKLVGWEVEKIPEPDYVAPVFTNTPEPRRPQRITPRQTRCTTQGDVINCVESPDGVIMR